MVFWAVRSPYLSNPNFRAWVTYRTTVLFLHWDVDLGTQAVTAPNHGAQFVGAEGTLRGMSAVPKTPKMPR